VHEVDDRRFAPRVIVMLGWEPGAGGLPYLIPSQNLRPRYVFGNLASRAN